MTSTSVWFLGNFFFPPPVLANITEGEKVCSGEITRDNMQKLNWKIITGSLLRAALMGLFVLPAR